MKRRTWRGQAATEYVIVLGALAIVGTILYGLVRVAHRYAIRAESLVMSDIP